MDYAEYLRDFKDRIKNLFVSAEGQSYTPGLDYLTDTHPTEDQFRKQQWLSIFVPWYAQYMTAKSHDEYSQNIRDLYDIDFEDIMYPWLSKILTNNSEMSIGSGAWDFSRNMWKLYKK